MKKENKRQVSIYFKYPPLVTLKKLTPKERVSYIERKLQKDYLSIKSKLAGHNFELIGTTKKPAGIKLTWDTKIINSILKLKFVDKSWSTELSGKKTKTKIEEPYFCFKVIFQIQIEGQTKGLQTYEERFILVKADYSDKAVAKVVKEARGYEKPYLNVYGQMVRWKFESIEESYHSIIESKDGFDTPVEVFSRLKTRRLKKENIWNGR